MHPKAAKSGNRRFGRNRFAPKPTSSKRDCSANRVKTFFSTSSCLHRSICILHCAKICFLPLHYRFDQSSTSQTVPFVIEESLIGKYIMRGLNEVQKLKAFCKSLPKVELHAHLNGSISFDTIQELVTLKREIFPEFEGLSDVEKTLLQPKDVLTMDEVFKLFPIVHSLTLHKEAIELATTRVIEEFAADGVMYLELRTTPKATAHMTKMDCIQAITSGIKNATTGPRAIVVKVLLSIDRSRGLKDAQDTVELLKQFVQKGESLIIGVDLSGNPKVDGRQYLPLLTTVREMGLKITLHLAELSNYIEELDALIAFKPDRIGHGTFIHSHGNASTVQFVSKHKIPLEICLTSNELCGTTKTVADSHFKIWKKLANPVCISTDDKGLMGSDLSNEYFRAAQAFDLSRLDLIDCAKTSLKAASLQHDDSTFISLKERLDFFEKECISIALKS
ncbi:hypothetical protein QR680_001568 [Steinernema hermaphroditum]|uniref:Adenosine deaminase domain-containing protein n=1 Tax=Steinernema hermaphroditum TaxID=289476 RepID=A0AA39GYW2_9BILA|nr:hypothetical protein QR680_001568 [Steinernema hermaphroditum]